MGAENSSKKNKGKIVSSESINKDTKKSNKQKIDKIVKNIKPRVNENRTNHAAKIPLSAALKASKSICKIIFEGNNERIEGTGFFIMANYSKFLITNYHNLNENLNNKIITIEIYNKETIQIIFDSKYCSFYEDIDITILEIKDNYELIKDIDFLDYDLDYKKGYEQYLNKDLFILQYPKNEIEIASGKIIEILNNNEFKHNLDVEIGSSGSPIILKSSLKVIGIHKEGDQFSFLNIGLFIGELFKKNKERFENNIIIGDYFSTQSSISNTLQNKEIDKKENIDNTLLNKEISKEKKLNKDDFNNYIIGEIIVYKKDISKSLRIINSYEEFNRSSNNKDKKNNCNNEKEIKECIIEVNDKLVSFSYDLKFDKEGKYKIKYNFPSRLTNCNHIFTNCSSLKNLDFSNFNTDNVIDVSGMLSGCSSLTDLDLSNFNTKNVTDMSCMFSGCSSLKKLDFSNFKTDNVIDMSGMLSGCSSLTDLDLSNFNTKKVTNMSQMFSGCSALKNLGLSNFDTQNVTDMKEIFRDCKSFTNIDLSNFNTKKVTDMSYMFSGCSSLNNLELSNFDTHNVTDMRGMFRDCKSFTNLDLSKFNTKKVTNMSYMFSGCSSLNNLRLSNFDTHNVTDMKEMFRGCQSFTNLDLSNFNTKNLIYISAMFRDCSSLVKLNLSNFNTKNVKDLDLMCLLFNNCLRLDKRYLVTKDSKILEFAKTWIFLMKVIQAQKYLIKIEIN